jgi:hypothetical protein
VFLTWSLDERGATSGHGWLESARKTSMASLVASHQPSGAPGAPGAHPGAEGERTSAEGADADGSAGVAAGRWPDRGGIDDDEHLAAYNAFLARLNQASPGPKR